MIGRVYPTDKQTAVALGLLLLSREVVAPCIRPAKHRDAFKAALPTVQGLGWPIRGARGRHYLPDDVRRAALRDGGTDWAGAVLAGLVVRRDGPVIELGVCHAVPEAT